MGKKTVEEIQSLIDGPVNSIPTPFLPDGGIDWQGFRNLIETGISGGSKVSLLTAGDSQLDSVSGKELVEMTRALVDQVRGRALTVAAVFRWWTRPAVEFACCCRDLGVDVLMVLPTERAADPKGLIAYYKAVAEVMPMMLVGYPAEAVLDGLVDTPGICAFKEDGTEAYAIRAMSRYGKRWKFITGGGYLRHYTQRPFGCRAYFSYFSCFIPKLAQDYARAIDQGDQAGIQRIVAGIEQPLFELSSAYPGGLQAVWRALAEMRGIASRYLRTPHLSLSDADMERLRQELKPLGLI